MTERWLAGLPRCATQETGSGRSHGAAIRTPDIQDVSASHICVAYSSCSGYCPGDERSLTSSLEKIVIGGRSAVCLTASSGGNGTAGSHLKSGSIFNNPVEELVTQPPICYCYTPTYVTAN